MAFIPVPTRRKLLSLEWLKKNRKKTAPPVPNPKSAEVKYRKQLNQLVGLLVQYYKANIEPLVIRLEPEYTADSYSDELNMAFNNFRKAFVDVGEQAKIVSNSFVEDTNAVNKKRFYKSMQRAIGVDVSTIIQAEGVEDILKSTTRSNVGLIESIPQKYFEQIENIVYNGVTRKNSAEGMIHDIMELNGSTFKRARVIARDQTSKLNGALTQQRQQNLGVEKYIWRTAGDGDRVRETHQANNGKIFSWNDPPKKTGHPGEDIQCRCIAEPIINI